MLRGDAVPEAAVVEVAVGDAGDGWVAPVAKRRMLMAGALGIEAPAVSYRAAPLLPQVLGAQGGTPAALLGSMI